MADVTIRRKRKRLVKQSNRKKFVINYKKYKYLKRSKQLKSIINRKMTSIVQSNVKRSQHQDEILFWKSKAQSLEFENKMLHKHIKEMYISMITQNKDGYDSTSKNFSDESYVEKNAVKNIPSSSIDDYAEYQIVDSSSFENLSISKDTKTSDEDEELSKAPSGEVLKKRDKEMKILYGNEWRKILGMETCVQLNFDLFKEKNKAGYWPVLPLKL